METAYYYVGLSSLLTILLWTPYIAARAFVWGIPLFLNNYPEGYPATQPEAPLWAQRAHRAHLNMVETLPVFIGVVLAAGLLVGNDLQTASEIGLWSRVFFIARLLHPIVYILAIPYLRTPVYLISWFSILMISSKFIF